MMNQQYSDYYTTHKQVNSYTELVDCLTKEFGEYWVFRAQSENGQLATSFERECIKTYFTSENAPEIEREMIRQFRRVYDGDDREVVQKDTLYCLSLMRHYLAPSRLLDFTYSKYVAIYFALECAYDNVCKNANGDLDYGLPRSCDIWCIETKELVNNVKGRFQEKYSPKEYASIDDYFESRGIDEKRNDESFLPLYWENKYIFVSHESPLNLHKRLHLQQGTFLCPGDIRKTFIENLMWPYLNGPKTNCIIKIPCTFCPRDILDAFESSMRANITREGLFPGLDGFAASFKYQLWFFKKLAKWRQ